MCIRVKAFSEHDSKTKRRTLQIRADISEEILALTNDTDGYMKQIADELIFKLTQELKKSFNYGGQPLSPYEMESQNFYGTPPLLSPRGPKPLSQQVAELETKLKASQAEVLDLKRHRDNLQTERFAQENNLQYSRESNTKLCVKNAQLNDLVTALKQDLDIVRDESKVRISTIGRLRNEEALLITQRDRARQIAEQRAVELNALKNNNRFMPCYYFATDSFRDMVDVALLDKANHQIKNQMATIQQFQDRTANIDKYINAGIDVWNLGSQGANVLISIKEIITGEWTYLP